MSVLSARQGYGSLTQADGQPPQNPPRSCCKNVALVAAYTLGTIVTVVEFGFGFYLVSRSITPEYPDKFAFGLLGAAFIVAGIVTTLLGGWTCQRFDEPD